MQKPMNPNDLFVTQKHYFLSHISPVFLEISEESLNVAVTDRKNVIHVNSTFTSCA